MIEKEYKLTVSELPGKELFEASRQFGDCYVNLIKELIGEEAGGCCC